MLHHQRRQQRKASSGARLELARVLLIAVGLVGKVCTTNAAGTVQRGDATHSNERISAVVKSSATPAQRYFDAVAPGDRENFIKYHLDQALEQRIPNYTSDTPRDYEFSTVLDALEPEDFSVDLLEHFMITFGLAEEDVYQFVALNVICFPSGWCFNPDDIGNICCPF